MTPNSPGFIAGRGRHRAVAAVAAVAMLGSFGLSGCGIGKDVGAIRKVSHEVSGNKATIDEFTSDLKSAPKAFEATYVTTGSNPTTVVYAAQPPKDVAFTESPKAGGTGGDSTVTVDLIVNSSGEYSCTPPSESGGSSNWACQKLGKIGAVTQNQILGFYTPAHWVVFLREFALAAGFAGDKISTSNLTVNGFSMHCVDFKTPGVKGLSKICTTTQGILGYVKVAADTTSFEITRYSASPTSSLFALPAGAKVTKVTTPNS